MQTTSLVSDPNGFIGRRKAARLMDISPELFDKARKLGHIAPLPERIGRRLLWRYAEFVAWMQYRPLPNREKWAVMRDAILPQQNF